jgi:hypothetical protein
VAKSLNQMTQEPTEEEREKIVRAIAAGNRIGAISMYISITECGLTEAQNFIKALTTELQLENPRISHRKNKREIGFDLELEIRRFLPSLTLRRPTIDSGYGTPRSRLSPSGSQGSFGFLRHPMAGAHPKRISHPCCVVDYAPSVPVSSGHRKE